MSRKLVILVGSARIVFAERQPRGGLKSIAGFDLEDFIAGRGAAGQFNDLRNRGIELLIVPDYWLGIKSLLISSPKRSVVEPYVLRKLRADHPDLPDVEHYFDYVPYRGEMGPSGVQAYYFQEMLFVQLCQRLEVEGLSSLRITTPGLLWEKKLNRLVEDFGSGGIFLINLIGSECFFYFFHRGRYLFSRDISVSDQLPFEERLDALSFEIDQSRFLFSQKTKAEIDRIFLVARGDKTLGVQAFGQRLGREVRELPVADSGMCDHVAEELNALLFFEPADFSPADEQVNLAHRQLRREQEWLPVQRSGSILGSTMVVVMLGIALALAWWAPPAPSDAELRELAQQRQTMRKASVDIDRLIAETRRPSPAHVLATLEEAMPAGVHIERLSLQSSPKPLLDLQGVISAADAQTFRQVLTQMVGELKSRIAGNDSLSAEGVEFELPVQEDAAMPKEYRFSLKVPLP